MAEVVLERVTKVFPGNVVAVDELSLEIDDGEFVVLVGPSGCGKTTTLRMIAGLEQISQGTIRIGGRVVNDIAPKDRDVAMVFQNYALYPHMTVFANMSFGLRMRNCPREQISQRVDQAARILGIEDLLQRKPKALSGGQQQRVAVGRAIVRDPQVFLFDEPLSNLDAKLRVQMRAELKRLHQRLGTTAIYVTHDQEEAMTLGQRLVILRDGLVQQCGTALEVYEHPANRFVASFIGTPTMNFFAGEPVREGGVLYFNEGTTKIRLPERIADQLAGGIGREVTLGVRPEAISISPPPPAAAEQNSLSVRVDVVEPLGEKVNVYATTGPGREIVARVDSRVSPQVGEQVRFYLGMDKVHLFAPGEPGKNLLLSHSPQ